MEKIVDLSRNPIGSQPNGLAGSDQGK